MKYLSVILFLLSCLTLTACSKDREDKPKTELEGGAGANSPTSTSEPTDQSATIAENSLVEADGYLIFIAGGQLHNWNPATSGESVALASGVSKPPDFVGLYPSPSGTSIIFGRYDLASLVLARLDVASSTVQDIATIGPPINRENWAVIGWSANEQWIDVGMSGFGSGPVVISTQALGDPIQYARSPRETYWLDDNQLLIVERNYQVEAYSPITALHVFSPETGEKIKLDMELSDIDSDMAFRHQLEMAGYSLRNQAIPGDSYVETNQTEVRRFSGTQFQRCANWQVNRYDSSDHALLETLYEDDRVAWLDVLSELTDGSVIFMRTIFADCQFSNPIGELVHLALDGTETILTTELLSVADRANLSFNVDGRATLSPNRKVVAWLATDENGETSQFHMYNLATENEIEPDLVGLEGAIESFVWVDAQE